MTTGTYVDSGGVSAYLQVLTPSFVVTSASPVLLVTSHALRRVDGDAEHRLEIGLVEAGEDHARVVGLEARPHVDLAVARVHRTVHALPRVGPALHRAHDQDVVGLAGPGARGGHPAAEPLASGRPFRTASSTSPRQSTNVVAPAVVAEKAIVDVVRRVVTGRQPGQVQLEVVAVDLEERGALPGLVLGQAAGIGHARQARPRRPSLPTEIRTLLPTGRGSQQPLTVAGCRAEPAWLRPCASGPTRRPSSLSRSREEPCRPSSALRAPSPEQSSCSPSSSAWSRPRRCSSHRLRRPRPAHVVQPRAAVGRRPGTAALGCRRHRLVRRRQHRPRRRHGRQHRVEGRGGVAPAVGRLGRPGPADQPRGGHLPAAARGRRRDLRRPVPLLARLQRRQGRHLLLPHRRALREGRQDLVHRPGPPHADRPHHRLQLPRATTTRWCSTPTPSLSHPGGYTAANAVVGERVTRTGSTSGTHSGTVTALNVTVRYQGGGTVTA